MIFTHMVNVLLIFYLGDYIGIVLWTQALFVDGCHGNNEIHMHIKFYLHVHYSWQV